MAEVLGTVVGVVSLGLQIEALHNRHQASGICSAPLRESMASAKAELLLLDEFVSKVRVEGETGADRSAGNMMKIQKKRLLYPFRRDRLDRLVTRLDVVIQALQAALQVFELSDVTMLGIERKIEENAALASLEMKNSFEQVVQTVSRSELTMLSIERRIDENVSLRHGHIEKHGFEAECT
ncbi:hypothetical protein K4K61_005850 [Colletotrichum sp. SAR11_59]|nr:hypothetical protein K4K61_005850 [Colletotrichum sp. SAR11_59]